MMMKFFWALLITTGLSATSCKKDIGPVLQNSDPPVASDWYYPRTDNVNTWREATNANNATVFTAELPAPEINQNTIDHSVILVYAKLHGYDPSIWPEGQVGLLPVSIFISTLSNTIDYWQAKVVNGKVIISVSNSDGIYSAGGIDKNQSFRYIVIPKSSGTVTGAKPGGATPLARYSEDELRNMSYDQLCNAAGIKK